MENLTFGVGFSSSLGGIAQEETNGDDDVAFLFNESVDVLLEISNFLGFEVFAFNTKLRF